MRSPKPIVPGQRYASVNEACAHLRISRATFYRNLRRPGSLLATKKMGGKTLVDLGSVEAWIASLPAA